MTNRYIVHEELEKIEPISKTEAVHLLWTKRTAQLIWGAIAWYWHFGSTILTIIMIGLLPLLCGILLAFGEAWYGMECLANGTKSIFETKSFSQFWGILAGDFRPQMLMPGIEKYFSNFYINVGNFQSLLHDYDGAYRSYAKVPPTGINLVDLAKKEIWLAAQIPTHTIRVNEFSGTRFRSYAVSDAGSGSALIYYSSAVLARYLDPVPLLQRAQYYAINGRYWETIQDCLAARRITRCPAYVHALLAYALNKVGRFQEAEIEADRAIQRAPQQADGYAMKALAAANCGAPDLASVEAGRSLTIDVHNPYALVAIARACSLNQSYDDAQSFAELAIKEDARVVDGYLELARAYIEKARYTDAVATLTKALEVSPHEAEAFKLRASALRKLNRPDDAILDEQRAN
jgi:tetratricopeptide (TPR) repeat protein